MTRETGKEGIKIIKEFEGLSLQAYRDSAKVWTIGYGHTKDVKEGDVIRPYEADLFLSMDLEEAEKAVEKLISAPLNQNQFDALVSFVFNLGAGTLQKSTLRKYLNLRLYWLVPKQIKLFINAGGRPLAGLIRRRAAEAELFARK